MKKYMILTLVVFSTLLSTALAQQINNLFVNGNPVASEQLAYLDTVANVTYVPLRAIVEELGGMVAWDENEQSICVVRNGVTAVLTVGSDKAVINGKDIVLDGPVKIDRETGRSMIPVTFFSEVLRCRIKVSAAAGISIEEGQSQPGAVIEERTYQQGTVNVIYPYFSGMNNKKAQAKMNREIEATIQTFIKDNTNEFTKEAMVKYNVQSLSQEIVSFTLTQYTYTGGAHGASGREGYTYDLATGIRYEFSDLFAFDNVARADINAQITAQIKDRGIPTFGPFQGISDRPYFYIADNGQPVIFFQQYEVGPYSVGILEFPVMAKTAR